eukprot:TRINITY_DN2999_c0_g1_i2.p1 TRINITY_DN2999_c0_g1~~TRINITY_DN2999_c0_g1_i2.p1  ORF type:complete len:284 (-),score=86.75 TRINITY_DN2999_c0_g1_i2:71-835(-)
MERHPEFNSFFNACMGLYYLRLGNYRQAARSFRTVTTQLGNEFSDIISLYDVAVYGALCSLASCSRSELRTEVLEKESFRDFLELVPELRQLINHFYQTQYASCMEIMQRIKSHLLLDLYLAPHVQRLYQMIRDEAFAQYFSPFLSVDMNRMAASFNMSVQQLEGEVADLIGRNKIQARIDSHNKVLYSKLSDQRVAAYQQALQVGGSYLRNAKSILWRMSLLKHNFMVEDRERTRQHMEKMEKMDRAEMKSQR